jgi:hypothetical protein
MPQYRVRREPQWMSRTPNTLRYLDIAAGYQPLTEPVGEQGAFKPTAFRQRRPAHYHACTDQVANLAGSYAWFLLGEAIAEAFEEVRWGLFPIENDASANATRLGLRPDCLDDGIQPSWFKEIIVVDKSNPRGTRLPDAASSGRCKSLHTFRDAAQARQESA